MNAQGVFEMTRSRSIRGFTLVEMLVVIIIISIVMALAAGGIVAALRTAKTRDTLATIRTLEGACERYKTRFRAYPPTDLTTVYRRVRQPNRTNIGGEALVACLSTEVGGGPFYQAPTESRAFCNTDSDTMSGRPTKPYYKTDQLFEYRDSWANPIIYIHSRDYGTQAKVVLPEGTVNWAVPILGDTRTFPNRNKFVIVSAGADGLLGTDDDITNY